MTRCGSRRSGSPTTSTSGTSSGTRTRIRSTSHEKTEGRSKGISAAGAAFTSGGTVSDKTTQEGSGEKKHHIDRELLVQDSHVHIPVYAITAALLVLIVFGLRLGSGSRIALVLLAFAAPVLDFVGLWGAHLWSGSGRVWGAVALLGGAMMGLVYLAVLSLTLKQCWFSNSKKGEQDA